MKIKGIIKSSLIDYPQKASTVIFLGGCNFKCGYCHNPELITDKIIKANEEKKVDEIETEDFVDFLKERKRFLDGVCISGGEPTIHDTLPHLIERIKALGYAVKLDTNGSNPRMLKGLIDSKSIDYIAMDIKGPSDKYKSIARCNIDFDTIKESARTLTNAYNSGEILCEFRTTVCKEQLSEEDLDRMINEHPNAPPWFLQRFVNQGLILDEIGTYSAYSIEEMVEMGRKLCASVR